MRTRTLLAAVVGLIVAVLAYRGCRAGCAGFLAATGLGSMLRMVFTSTALFFVIAGLCGALALGVSTWLFLLIAGKLNAKRWRRGLLWSIPVFLIGLAFAPPGLLIIAAATVSMCVSS